MEIIKKCCVLLFAIALASACSNDFELTDKWKDIPVVYGLLSAQDSINYIRVEKAFLDQTTSAFEIAQRPDSLYYENATVQVIHKETGDAFNLERIDGNSIGLAREGGIFANMPNILYKLALPLGQKLQDGNVYELKINRGDDKELVTAETKVLDEMVFRKPLDAANIDILYGERRSELDLRWSFGEGTVLFDVEVIFHYAEFNINNPSEVEVKELAWLAGKSLELEGSTTSLTFEILGLNFYQFLGNNIEADPELRRVFQHFDIVVTGGGEEIKEYITVGQAATGITSSQITATYSNLSEGFGIFSSTSEISLKGFTLRTESRDTLADGVYTKDLNFGN